MHCRTKIIIGAFLLAILDQISKWWVLSTIREKPLYLIGESIGFIYSENTGIAFSIPLPMVAIIILNIVLFCVLFWVFEKEFKIRNRITQVALALIIGGGLGNLIDRFLHGFVVDFVALWSYPRFNLADAFITIGVLLVLAFYAKIKRA